jgi:hypothetical protein
VKIQPRRRWVAPSGLAVAAVAVALAFGVPVRGCDGDASLVCPPLVEAPVHRPLAAAGPPRVVFLNREAITLSPGRDDAANGVSSIVKTPTAFPAATLDDATWSAMKDCLATELNRFNVSLTDQRPAQGGYQMIVFGGTGSELEVGVDSRGDAPQDKSGCQVVEGAVAFVFSGKLSGAQEICEVAAHELGHTYSLDHSLLASDVMSYLPFTGHRSFQDVDVLCGESQQAACSCGRSSQNPVQVLLDRAGGVDTETAAPTLTAEANVPRPGFAAVTVHALDPSGISTVSLTFRDSQLFIATTCGDGQTGCIVDGSTFTFTIAGTSGRATYTATAVDTFGNVATTVPAQVGDDAAPGAPPMTFALKAPVATDLATPSATISGGAVGDARLFWTDARGVTMSRPMCSQAGNQWSRGVQLSDSTAPRSFTVVATGVDGHVAASAPYTLTAPAN